jgi:hypothetical protein
MNPVVAMWLWVLTWAKTPRAQCMGCGGKHSLSGCTQPVIDPKQTEVSGWGGAFDQGRRKCTCRKQ